MPQRRDVRVFGSFCSRYAIWAMRKMNVSAVCDINARKLCQNVYVRFGVSVAMNCTRGDDEVGIYVYFIVPLFDDNCVSLRVNRMRRMPLLLMLSAQLKRFLIDVLVCTTGSKNMSEYIVPSYI